ncbi:MAG TPA: hypothetical protein VMW47_08715 [Verrucomicrobiae bacterium]|nr:hypothetical protein [Verrucomicrobiae bacterium]
MAAVEPDPPPPQPAPEVVAALDVGSNTIHLLVATTAPGGLVARRHAVVLARLGRRVAALGQLGPEAVGTTAATVAELVALARGAGAQRIVLAATEAIRRASDREQLVRAVQQRCGLALRILSGEEEAQLSFLGATASGVSDDTEVVVFDLGGASTEVALGRGPTLRCAVSLRIGSDALVQRHAFGDPPSSADRAAAAVTIGAALADAPPGSPRLGIATGGTAANLPWLLQGTRPARAEGPLSLGTPGTDAPVELSLQDLVRAQAVTDAHPSAEVARARRLHPERARLLAGGTQLLVALARAYQLGGLTVTERGLRDGLLLSGSSSPPGQPDSGIGGDPVP